MTKLPQPQHEHDLDNSFEGFQLKRLIIIYDSSLADYVNRAINSSQNTNELRNYFDTVYCIILSSWSPFNSMEIIDLTAYFGTVGLYMLDSFPESSVSGK